MREIFVSYSQPDRQCALELTEYLEAHGLGVWIAPRDVSPAAEWAAEIIDAISNSRVFVLVFSASSNESAQVRREVERAVHKDRPILPFRIEDVLPSRSLEYFLSSQHWLDGFPPPREPHYARLCTALGHWLSEDGTARGTFPAARPPAAALGAVRSSDGTLDIPARFQPGELRSLETRLARLIGPVARVLVGRAAEAATDLQDLERRLAAELDSSQDRQQFLKECQWSRARRQ